MDKAPKDQAIWRRFAPAIFVMGLASCGAGSDKAVTQFTLTSDAFANGQPIPAQYTCDGADQSPPLDWSEPPAGTKSFALIVDDPDAPSRTFRHWGAYDIPAAVRSIPAGQALGTQAVNDFGKPGYGGPCPPKGHGPHHYRFKLLALNVPSLGLHGQVQIGDLEREAENHLVGRGELVGTYERR
jgi:Raf kinase inhibitor-like YbhB/YbcL family protein